MAPSALYRSTLWRLGLSSARLLPVSIAKAIAFTFGNTYWAVNTRRRRIVAANLAPALNQDQGQAHRLSRVLFQNFAQKILDLWQYEAGLPVEHLAPQLQGWKSFAAAHARGRGVLLLTPHLGNWELGAPLLAARGVKITVVTLNEPDRALTELRKASRARWGIETFVIGDNPFAFVDIIRRLEAGGVVALLVDRPPAPTSSIVQLFGRPFEASLAPADLARASGCVLLPVVLPRTAAGYEPQVLPEVPYHRAALGSRAARQQLTQEIVNVFAPTIQQHVTQWYHFVPIWK